MSRPRKQTNCPRICSSRAALKFRDWVFPGGYSPAKTAGKCTYDAEAAARAINFVQRFVIHSKGDLGGQRLRLETWQKAIFAATFGWKRPNGRRRYRFVFAFMPRKNGKSKLAEGVALALAYADKEPGAEVYSVAADRPQAGIVFRGAKHCVESEPILLGRSQTYRQSIDVLDPLTGAVTATYTVLSSDAAGAHGYNPSGVIADEVHAHKKRDLVDVMRTGMGARSQPLFFAITSAGINSSGIGYEMYEQAVRVRDGVVDDESFLPVIYEVEEGDDWRHVKTWRKANPNLDVSIQKEWLREECRRAAATPALLNAFLAFHLNRWVSSLTSAMTAEAWRKCYVDPKDWPDLGKVDAYGGVDLAHSSDLCAFVLTWLVDGVLYVRPRFWIPRDRAIEVEKTHSISYSAWERAGHITLTDGNVTDYGFIREAIKSDVADYNVQGIGVDPYNATHLLNLLSTEDGIKSVAKFGQATGNVNEPYKDLLETRIPGQTLAHDGNQVMKWCAANVATKTDAGDRWRPTKKGDTPAHKIDGITALTIANGMRIAAARDGQSVYQERGVLAF